MRYVRLVPLVLLALLIGCGSTKVVHAPPKLHTPKHAENAVPVQSDYLARSRRCHKYHYVTDEFGHRHRAPCPHAPSPTPPPRPPGPTPVTNPTPASGCGIERWAVKTLTDPGANAVNLTPQDTTIAALNSIAPPVQPTDRVAPVETTTWRIKAHMDAFKQEADSDIHLAVHDDQGTTMIAEFPSPSCDQGSTVAQQITAARDAFTSACGQPGPSYQSINGDATITGVGFFDRIHGQRGVAVNGIELHPVTAFNGACH